jgi:NAD-dependent SIR2 family protein deacetylase
MNRRGGRGRMGGPYAAGVGGYCKCTNCDYQKPHQAGIPCNSEICPKCGARMIRA